MEKIYIYPTYNPKKDKSGNLYIKYFHDSFRKNTNYKIYNKKGKYGIISLFFNLNANIFIIQWVDLIKYKRFGYIQILFFLLGLIVLKITKKKIIWILHNKHAHKEKSLVVDYLMDIMAIISNKVVVHSSDGIKFFTERFSSESEDKVIYIPHPVYPVNNSYKKNIDKIEWDYIIWGTITERKQLHNLIFKINKGDILKNKRILICGKCSDEDYFNKLSNMLPSNVTLINKFCSDEELSEYIMKSKYILFTYNSSSLLSSGALIYSLGFNKIIIGPNNGNFRDFPDIVYCYNEFEDIETLNFETFDKNLTDIFFRENTWDNFPNKLLKSLYIGIL